MSWVCFGAMTISGMTLNILASWENFSRVCLSMITSPSIRFAILLAMDMGLLYSSKQ